MKITNAILKERVANTRERLLAVVEALPEETLRQPELIDGLSIAELLLFLGEWGKEVAFGLREVQRRKKPTQTMRAIEHEAKWREKVLTESNSAKFTIADLLFELDEARYDLNDRLDQFNVKDLNEPKRHRWLGNKPLWPFIATNTYEHEAAYLPTLEALVRQVNS